LVEQIAEREIFRVVVDGHRGHDLLRIEEDRERALDRHPGLDRLPGLVDAADALGQPRIERVGPDQEFLAALGHGVSMLSYGADTKAGKASAPLEPDQDRGRAN